MKLKHYYILISTMITCGLLAVVEQILEINYLFKTGLKIALFLLTIWIYIKAFHGFRLRDVVTVHKLEKRNGYD